MADLIVPCNPGYFDVFSAFDSLDMIDWRQSVRSIETGDHVYIYVSSPVQAVAFRCRVLETMIPPELVDRSDERFNLSDALQEDQDVHVYMRLKLDRIIPKDIITLQKMRSAGRVPAELKGLFD